MEQEQYCISLVTAVNKQRLTYKYYFNRDIQKQDEKKTPVSLKDTYKLPPPIQYLGISSYILHELSSLSLLQYFPLFVSVGIYLNAKQKKMQFANMY